MNLSTWRLVRVYSVVAVILAVVFAVRCGTPASAMIPPSNEEVQRLIMQNDRPLGFQAVTAVTNISVGGFNAGTGTWTIQADVQYGGVLPARKSYLVYRDTQGRWAIKKQ
jgi:hypothetical protein